MEPNQISLSRREFVERVAVAGISAGAAFTSALAAAEQEKAATGTARLKLGLDNFAVRGMEWKAAALIDYAASLKLDSLFISDLDAFESFDADYLRGLRSKANDSGLQIHVGTWSICPTSTTFKKKWGTAEEHLALGIRVAKALGSPVIRVILTCWKSGLSITEIDNEQDRIVAIGQHIGSREIRLM